MKAVLHWFSIYERHKYFYFRLGKEKKILVKRICLADIKKSKRTTTTIMLCCTKWRRCTLPIGTNCITKESGQSILVVVVNEAILYKSPIIRESWILCHSVLAFFHVHLVQLVLYMCLSLQGHPFLCSISIQRSTCVNRPLWKVKCNIIIMQY